MSLLSKTASKYLGASWKTTLLGMGGAAIQATAGFLVTDAFPGMSDEHKLQVWGVALGGAIFTAVKGYYTKDKDVSNSSAPVAASAVKSAVKALDLVGLPAVEKEAGKFLRA